jgi:hypothetical protein
LNTECLLNAAVMFATTYLKEMIMFTKFLSALLLLVSINCFAQGSQSREQLGNTIAQCAAYSMHANIWFIKLNDIKNAIQWRENMEDCIHMANKLIGKSKASEIITDTSKRIRSLQSNQEAYINEIFRGVKLCNDYINVNSSSIKSMMK